MNEAFEAHCAQVRRQMRAARWARRRAQAVPYLVVVAAVVVVALLEGVLS